MKVALVTPCINHLPFHPNFFLGYGAAILAKRYDLTVIDLNAEYHFKHRKELKKVLGAMDQAPIVSDTRMLHPFYEKLQGPTENFYAAIPWKDYSRVYVTTPSWFPTVPTEAVLKLTDEIRRVSPGTQVFFFGSSLGSWTNEEALNGSGVETVHLNGLLASRGTAGPVHYDLLPPPVYEPRSRYLFDLLPFVLKHGCSWGRCRFCSLSKGGNAGFLERSARAAFTELEGLVARYDPAALICRDHSLNGRNLIEFCGYLETLKRPWCGQTRPDMPGKTIEALAKAGCRGVFFGLESGSDRLLQAMDKGISSRQISNFIKKLHAHGILPAPSLIIGYPGERNEDFEASLQFLVKHGRYLQVVNLYPFMATPGSAIVRQDKLSAGNVLMKMIRISRTCEDLGLKVVIGEQSIEFFLFNWIFRKDLP